MFTITKRFSFSASHVLSGLPDGHPCGRLHGHNYEVEIVQQAETLDGTGFVEDYGKLHDVKDWINTYLDHRHLNDVMGGQPSAENIAKTLYHTFKDAHPKMVAVLVSETPKTWVEYRP